MRPIHSSYHQVIFLNINTNTSVRGLHSFVLGSETNVVIEEILECGGRLEVNGVGDDVFGEHRAQLVDAGSEKAMLDGKFLENRGTRQRPKSLQRVQCMYPV